MPPHITAGTGFDAFAHCLEAYCVPAYHPIAEGVGDIGIVAGTVDIGALQTFPFRSDRFVVVTSAERARSSSIAASRCATCSRGMDTSSA